MDSEEKTGKGETARDLQTATPEEQESSFMEQAGDRDKTPEKASARDSEAYVDAATDSGARHSMANQEGNLGDEVRSSKGEVARDRTPSGTRSSQGKSDLPNQKPDEGTTPFLSLIRDPKEQETSIMEAGELEKTPEISQDVDLAESPLDAAVSSGTRDSTVIKEEITRDEAPTSKREVAQDQPTASGTRRSSEGESGAGDQLYATPLLGLIRDPKEQDPSTTESGECEKTPGKAEGVVLQAASSTGTRDDSMANKEGKLGERTRTSKGEVVQDQQTPSGTRSSEGQSGVLRGGLSAGRTPLLRFDSKGQESSSKEAAKREKTPGSAQDVDFQASLDVAASTGARESLANKEEKVGVKTQTRKDEKARYQKTTGGTRSSEDEPKTQDKQHADGRRLLGFIDGDSKELKSSSKASLDTAGTNSTRRLGFSSTSVNDQHHPQGGINAVQNDTRIGRAIDEEQGNDSNLPTASPVDQDIVQNETRIGRAMDEEQGTHLYLPTASPVDPDIILQEEQEEEELERLRRSVARMEGGGGQLAHIDNIPIAIPQDDSPSGEQEKTWAEKYRVPALRIGLLSLMVLTGVGVVVGLVFGRGSDQNPRCFSSAEDLRSNIDAFFEGGNSAEALKQRYGASLGDWCVSGVQDFSSLFSVDRNPRMVSFTENISDWDMSSATNTSRMFSGAEAFSGDLSGWKVGNVVDMAGMFHRAASFNQNLSSWDVSRVNDMTRMFEQAASFDQPLSGWDVSNVENMNSLFFEASSFNQDLSSWNVSHVRTMRWMFYWTPFNQDISGWDVGNVVDMVGMFSKAASFNQHLSSWDVSLVREMADMFHGAILFNQPLSAWDVASVKSMQGMFNDADKFNHDLSAWNVSSVTDASHMFQGSSTTFDQDLSTWDVSSMVTMKAMFNNVISFNQDLSAWNVSCVKTMHAMFNGAVSFDRDLSSWDVSNVENMESMFHGAAAFQGDLSFWNVSRVVDMGFMFESSLAFNQDLSTWDVSNVQTMKAMFQKASSFNQDLSSWNVSHVNNAKYMFYAASSFDGDLSTWDVSNFDSTAQMFYDAAKFNHDLSTWNVSNVVDFSYMFFGAKSFNQDVSMWDLSNAKTLEAMFYDAIEFNQDLSLWSVSRVKNLETVFAGAASFDQDLSAWDVSSVENMVAVFEYANSFNHDLSGWNVSKAIGMSYMFYRASSFDQDISLWDVAGVQAMDSMFLDAILFNQDLSRWNVSKVTHLGDLFSNATSFNQNLCAWGSLLHESANVTNTFTKTSCPAVDDPDLSALTPGPFCHPCIGVWVDDPTWRR